MTPPPLFPFHDPTEALEALIEGTYWPRLARYADHMRAWLANVGWLNDPVHYAAKVAEEAGEVLGATLKMDPNGRAATHPGHDLEHLRQEIGQLTGTLMVLAEHYGIDPMEEAEAELLRVMVRFPVEKGQP